MKVHVCRVQFSKKREWWIQGERPVIDVVKTSRSLAFATQLYEDTNHLTVECMIGYKGICSPTEAAMTLSDVVSAAKKGGAS